MSDAAGSQELTTGADTDKSNVLLETNRVSKSFGGLLANDNVTLQIETGTITGMIGPNGAGKSTLFNIISGFYEEDSGSVFVGDTEVTDMVPYEIAGEGLIRTFQTPRKLEGMTVREAMLLGPQKQTGESIVPLFTDTAKVRREERRNLTEAEEMLERFEIGDLARSPATEISGGQLKLVELARAMMAEPDILLLDEPVAGVNPTLTNKLADFIEELNDEGITFLIIEHDIGFIMDIADPIIVLNQGSVLVEGSPEAVRNDERVLDAYLGGAGP